MTDELIEQVARDIADALGDNFDYAFAGKSDWVAHRGETPAGFRDVNQPYKPDYIDAAIAALAAINLPAQLEAARTQGWNEAFEAAAEQCELWANKFRLALKNAQARKQRQEVRDLESIAMSVFRAFETRALTKENSDD